MTLVMTLTAKPAMWLSAFNLFGGDRIACPRFHWYRDGAEQSACGNYRRPFAALTWTEQHQLCPRCTEALQFAGEPIPPLVPPPPPESDDEADALEELT